jgi:hypothetical protein
MKNKSTTIYGNIVALDESPLKQGLLYVGTDDGLIQVSDNDGKTWNKYISVSNVPAMTYINQLKASHHDANTVYAVLNNHKRGDFKPYIYKSTDKGKNWVNISGNLPKKGSVYCIEEDHKNPNLLFAGTEYGLFVTLDGGKNWTQLKTGLPTIAIRDMEIQERESDLVLASFGRSFYVLDNYSPLRELAENKSILNKQFHFFDVKKSLMFIESNPLGYKKKNAQGESYYAADNPPVGAIIRFHFKDTLKTAQEIRRDSEKKITNAIYPSKEQIHNESLEEKAYLLFVIKDENGNEIQKIKTNASAGIHKIVWNHRYSSTTPIKLKKRAVGRYGSADVGQLALPGTYSVSAYLVNNGVVTTLGKSKTFEIELLNNHVLVAKDKKALLQFQKEVSELKRSVYGTDKLYDELKNKLKYIKTAIETYPNVDLTLLKEVKTLEQQMIEIDIALYGDYTIGKHEFETYPGISERISNVIYGLWNSTSAPTQTSINNIKIAKEEYQPVLAKVKIMVKKIKTIEDLLTKLKVPYTPGRDENWKEN